jgi:hypothetical protein
MYSKQDSRDPEDRLVDKRDPLATKDKMFDKTIADTFPASDPLSSLPDPDEDSFAARFRRQHGKEVSPSNAPSLDFNCETE